MKDFKMNIKIASKELRNISRNQWSDRIVMSGWHYPGLSLSSNRI